MSTTDFESAIAKLQYHVSVLSQAVDSDRFPVEHLVLQMNWEATDLNKAHDIFEKWDSILEDGGAMNTSEFENDFKTDLGVSYQGLKSIILAFYRNGQWTSVCEAYVDAFGETPALEFHSIARRSR